MRRDETAATTDDNHEHSHSGSHSSITRSLKHQVPFPRRPVPQLRNKQSSPIDVASACVRNICLRDSINPTLSPTATTSLPPLRLGPTLPDIPLPARLVKITAMVQGVNHGPGSRQLQHRRTPDRRTVVSSKTQSPGQSLMSAAPAVPGSWGGPEATGLHVYGYCVRG